MLMPYNVTRYPQVTEPTNEVLTAWTCLFFFFPHPIGFRCMLGDSEQLQKYRTLPQGA